MSTQLWTARACVFVDGFHCAPQRTQSQAGCTCRGGTMCADGRPEGSTRISHHAEDCSTTPTPAPHPEPCIVQDSTVLAKLFRRNILALNSSLEQFSSTYQLQITCDCTPQIRSPPPDSIDLPGDLLKWQSQTSVSFFVHRLDFEQEHLECFPSPDPVKPVGPNKGY